MNFPEQVVWDEEKNELLLKTRGIGFEELERQIRNNEVLEVIENPSIHHANQKIIIFQYQDYIWNCPCLIEENQIVLKTIFKNRKHNALYS